MRRMGDLNFTLEDIVQFLYYKEDMKPNQIVIYVYNELKKYPEAREEYEDGTFPKFKITGSLKRIKSIHITKKFNKLIKEYVEDHDLQWGEVLYTVYGYLILHPKYKKDKKLESFIYEPDL